jgi:hypothetical protein
MLNLFQKPEFYAFTSARPESIVISLFSLSYKAAYTKIDDIFCVELLAIVPVI